MTDIGEFVDKQIDRRRFPFVVQSNVVFPDAMVVRQSDMRNQLDVIRHWLIDHQIHYDRCLILAHESNLLEDLFYYFFENEKDALLFKLNFG